MDWTYHLTHWFWGGLDWLYPPACGGCGRAGFRWCPVCQEQISRLPEPLCSICGLPRQVEGICAGCLAEKPPYQALRSWVAFEGPIRQALHRLKYRRNLALGEALARPMAEFVAGLGWPVEMVIPIPLAAKRMQERGYNQVGLVARPLAARTGWRYAPRALTRPRETRSQVGLSAAERRENVRGAFRAAPEQVAGRTVLLVDDVATTGATLNAAAEALLCAGAREVYALTIARALPHHGLKIV